MASAKQRGTVAAGMFWSPFSSVDFLKNDVIDMANYHEHSESNYSGQSQHNSMTLCTANRGCGLRFGAPLIECGEYDRPEFVGTDHGASIRHSASPKFRTLRALRAEKIEPCVAGQGRCAKISNPPCPRSVKSAVGRRRRKIEIFDLKVFLGNRFFRPGNSPIFRLVTAPARNFEHSGAQLQAAPRWKQAGKRRTLRPPVPEFRTPMSIGGALAKFEPS